MVSTIETPGHPAVPVGVRVVQVVVHDVLSRAPRRAGGRGAAPRAMPYGRFAAVVGEAQEEPVPGDRDGGEAAGVPAERQGQIHVREREGRGRAPAQVHVLEAAAAPRAAEHEPLVPTERGRGHEAAAVLVVRAAAVVDAVSMQPVKPIEG